MGSQQQFCLRWNNHQINMLGVFDQLLQTEALVDVTIACEGLSLKAHKVVLSACSPFFQSLFLDNPCKHPIVILKDVKYSDLKALVDFMYRGEVNVSQEHLSALLQTAETLKVKGLAEVTGGMGDVPGESNGRTVSAQQGLTHDESLASQLDESKHSPPSKRKKVRSRRRSGGSSNQSDREDDEMQIPAEVVETKVEIVDEDDDRLQHEQSLEPIPTSTSQTFQHGESKSSIASVLPSQQSEPDLTMNRSYGSSAGMEVLPCTSMSNSTSTSALNRTVHLPPPLIPAQTSVPVLPVPSFPSTSGNQPPSQDHMAAFRLVKRRRAFPIRGNESIRMAVEAVINYNISFREAARRFGVNHSTVYNHVKFARMRQAKIFEKSNMVKLEQ